MAVGDVYQCDLDFTLDTKKLSVSQYYLETTLRSGTIEELSDELGKAVVTQLWTDFWQLFAADKLDFIEIRTQMIYPTREAPWIDATDSGVGTQAGDALPSFNAVLVAEYGSDWGRRFQGRIFLPGLPETDELDGQIESDTYATLRVSAEIALTDTIDLEAGAGGVYAPCVFSRKQVADGFIPVASPIITATTRQTITHQIKRKRTSA